MILYHGSSIVVQFPDLSFARDNTDFGRGFYTNPDLLQAKKWAERFKRRNGSGVVSFYEVDVSELRKTKPVLEFDGYSVEWLDYIVKCRQGLPAGNFDLVIGGIANDDVFNTLTLFFRGFIDKTEAIKRLRYEKPNIQYCFKTRDTIGKYLMFKGSEIL